MDARITRRTFGWMFGGTILSYGVCFAKGTKDMDLAITVETQVVDGMLRVAYALRNGGKHPLLAYDGSPGLPADAEWPSLDGQIYVSVVGDSVALKRINPPVPADEDINRVFIPPLSETLPGQTRKVKFCVKLPLTERSQYTPDFAGAVYKEHSVRRVEICVGCFWRNATMELQPLPANPKAFRLKTAHGPQSILCGASMQTVPVRERTDDKFQRI
jgi:hypothetical protein